VWQAALNDNQPGLPPSQAPSGTSERQPVALPPNQGTPNQGNLDGAPAAHFSSSPLQDREAALAALRGQIKAIEAGPQTLLPENGLPENGLEDTGPPAADDPQASGDLPALPAGWVHELWAEKPLDMGAATGLLLASVPDGDSPVLWITSPMVAREHGLPYGPGLKAVGLDPARLILVRPREQRDTLWTIEEGLKVRGLAAVIGEVGAVDLKASRRLAITAREHGTKALMLVRSTEVPASAAFSRFQLTALESAEPRFDAHAPGPARLMAELIKHRGGKRPENYCMEWQHASHRFHLVAAMADRALASGPAPERRPQKRPRTRAAW